MDENRAQGDRPPKVTVYTGNDCFWCTRAKQYLESRGIQYEEINVDENEAVGPKIVAMTGQRHVPVIVVGTHAVVGFRKPELDAELDALLGGQQRETMGLPPDLDLIDPRF